MARAAAEDPDTTRTRIMAAADRHFRSVGYTKTTVADIARTAHMSPANVYRFFDSKAAINEAMARRMLGKVEDHVRAIAAQQISASQRITAFILGMQEQARERFLDETRVHEMVRAAMEEHWTCIHAHLQVIGGLIGQIIADGARAGEFRVDDVEIAAKTTLNAIIKFYHPLLVAQRCCQIEDGDEDRMVEEARQMADFVIRALGG